MIFELTDHDHLLLINPIKLMFPDAQSELDRNLIHSKVVIKAGGFKAEYFAEFMTVDFEKFKQGLSKLYENLDANASFDCLERYLTIKIEGDGLGHFTALCNATDNPGFEETEMSFYLHFDQTQIKDLVHQLDLITTDFPITGDFKIKNE